MFRTHNRVVYNEGRAELILLADMGDHVSTIVDIIPLSGKIAPKYYGDIKVEKGVGYNGK